MMQENLVQLVPVILKSLTEKLLLVAKVRIGNICGMSGLEAFLLIVLVLITRLGR